MFRVRAVESPANAEGVRTIWHRGPRGAELITDIDATGRVLRQRLTILDDVLLWRRDQGLSTTLGPSAAGAAATPVAEFGARAAAAGADSRAMGAGSVNAPIELPLDGERLTRAAASLGFYTGQDRFLAHLRDQVLAVHPPSLPGASRAPARVPPRGTRAGWVIALGLLLALASLALALLRSTR
jgi:hypothetical protein